VTPIAPIRSDGEKRRSPRVQVELTAHCQIGHDFHRLPVADLSRGGLRLTTRERTREGTPVRVAIALPLEDGVRFCTFSGHVARVAVDPMGRTEGLGVCFVEAERVEVDHDALVVFLDRLGA